MERRTVGDAFDRIALGGGEHTAAVFPQSGVRWSYRELHARANQLAKALMGLGVDAGSRVAIWAPDRPEWLVLQLATAKVGAVLVPIDPSGKPAELAAILDQSEVAALFLIEGSAEPRSLDLVLELCPELGRARPGRLTIRRFPTLKRVALLGGGAAAAPGVLSWTDVLAAGAGITDHLLRLRQDGVDAADAATILFAPDAKLGWKGAELAHRSLVDNAADVGDCMRLTRRDRVCLALPLARAAGCVLGVLGSLGRGATLVVPADLPDTGAILEALARERCTALYGDARLFASAVRHPRVLGLDFSSLRTGLVLGHRRDPGLVPEIVSRLHMPDVTVAYGCIETAGAVTQTRSDDSLDLRATTVGRALPHVEVKVVDPKTGVEVARGTEGELCCRGSLVMRGYYNRPDATAAVLGANGWLRTGDLAVMDQYGYCALVGRLDASAEPHQTAAR